MKILLTGVAGFIGSHVAEALLALDHHVIGIDNFNDYYSPAQKRSNVLSIERHSRAAHFSMHELDLQDREGLARLFVRESPEVIVHLAAMAGVRYSVEHPQLYIDVNITGTLNLLELAKHGCKQFVFASTSSVYGDTERIPFVESDTAAQPKAPYPASKRAGELLGYSYHHLYSLNFTALRFFTVYGPRNRPDMMAYKLMDSALHGHEVALYNGGEMWRDWTYVCDIAQGVVSAAERSLGYELINLGRGEPVSLKDFITKVEAQCGCRTHLKDAPAPSGDMMRTYANTDKARALLGYQPRVSVDEGISELLAWFKGLPHP